MTAPPHPPDRAGGSARAGDGAGDRSLDRALTVLLPALLAYVPLLLTAPGRVGADTKTYLYLDPGRLLAGAPSMWDAETGMGTVSHQNIGYLFPMGPFYWLAERLGSPDWLAQRLWLGTVLFLAALGVRFLIRTLAAVPQQWSSAAVLVASLAYMFSPYVLDYSARISVILLPYTALPWLIALTARSIRRGGWRDPAGFALVALAAGGINATALIMVGVAPVLWFAYEWLVERQIPGRALLAPFARIGLLTTVTSLWWIAGLWAQGRYGLPVLRYTESYRTVAEASSAPEVLRGLGYWFFYGEDKLGQWIEPSEEYTTRLPLLVVSFLIPVLALLSAALVRWRHRAYVLTVMVVGALISVGSHPWDDPSPLGAAFKAFTRTDAGLALRSTPRAVPLVALGSALLLGAGVSALGRRLPRAAGPSAALVTLLLLANFPTQWNGTMVASNLERPEEIPTYWQEAIAHLDAGGTTTRVLEVPGADFASYRWGNTVDPITPGLTDRPYVARELFQYGSPPSADLLLALDTGLHDGTFEPDSLAPLARLMGIGEVVLRSDLQYERYRVARPRPTWHLLLAAAGLGEPLGFGDPTPNVAGPEQPMLDEIELSLDPDLPHPPPVAVFPVEDARPIVRAVTADRPLLLAGDGAGMVAAAGASLLDADQAVFYAADVVGDDVRWARTYDAGADLLVTDTNRQRGRRWGGVRENTGYTEQRGEEPLRFDPGDNRLELFPDAEDESFTHTELTGVSATATDYGNPVTYTPDDRPANAVDGDPLTAWRTSAIDDPRGQRLVIAFDEAVTTDHVTLTQPTTLVRNRWLSRVRLHFPDGTTQDVELGLRSQEQPGQRIDVGPRTFDHLEIEILDTDVGERPRYDGLSAVGFAEVEIPGATPALETVVPPTDLLSRAGRSSADHRLTFLFTRLRTNPAEAVRTDEETHLVRAVEVPTDRAFALDGRARLSASTPDVLLDELLGTEGPQVRASARLPGALRQRPSAAHDGDPATHWSSIFERQEGHWIEVEGTEPLTVDRLDLAIVADGRHSVPTRVRLDADGVPVAHLDLPRVEDGERANEVVPVPVELPRSVTATRFRLTIEEVREVDTVDWYTGNDLVMPVAIAEIGLPGPTTAPPATDRFDSGCRDDLLTVDGEGVPLRVSGDLDAALDREPLTVSACGSARDGLALEAGSHLLATAPGRTYGIDLDEVVLGSERGGAPLARADQTGVTRDPAPGVTVETAGRTDFDLRVEGNDTPSWLVLGQSWSDGWTATVEGTGPLGSPTVVNGFANGWYLDPADVGTESVEVTLDWAPQRIIDLALLLSAIASLACAGLVLFLRRRPPPPGLVGPDGLRVDVAGQPSRTASPTLVGPFTPAGRGDRRTAVLVGLVVGVVTVANTPLQLPWPGPVPWSIVMGLAAGTVAAVALRWERGGALAGFGAAGCLALAGAYTVVQQFRHAYPADFIWPQNFGRVHPLGLLTLFFLLAQALRDVTARGGPPTSIVTPTESTPDQEPE